MIFKVKTKYFDANGKPVGRSIVTKKNIDLHDIISYEQVVDQVKGELVVRKTKCMLLCNAPIGTIIVEKSFDSMHSIVNRNSTIFIKGYVRYGNEGI